DLLADPSRSSFARIYFGSANPSSRTFTDTNSFLLRLPAPVQNVSVFGSQSVFAAPGDYNGDGLDDIAVAVSVNAPSFNLAAGPVPASSFTTAVGCRPGRLGAGPQREPRPRGGAGGPRDGGALRA